MALVTGVTSCNKAKINLSVGVAKNTSKIVKVGPHKKLFFDMYQHAYDEIVDSGIVTGLDEGI